MQKSILIILIDKRKDEAVQVQKILTEWGCLIKTRLGIHDGVMDQCSEQGLIICELVGEKEKQENMRSLIDNLPGVSAKITEIGL